jgi:hypothetical protein
MAPRGEAFEACGPPSPQQSARTFSSELPTVAFSFAIQYPPACHTQLITTPAMRGRTAADSEVCAPTPAFPRTSKSILGCYCCGDSSSCLALRPGTHPAVTMGCLCPEIWRFRGKNIPLLHIPLLNLARVCRAGCHPRQSAPSDFIIKKLSLRLASRTNCS